MGRSQQRKGARGEHELAGILQEEGFDVVRGASRSFGSVPDISGLPGIHVEVKRAERLNLEEAMEQAERDAHRFGDGDPAVFHRRNRCEWMVTMRLPIWIKLYKKAQQENKNDG